MMDARAAFPILAGLFWLCSAAQPAPKESAILETEKIVNNIDSHLKEWNRSRVVLQTGTDRGGELTIYRRGSDVVRMDAIIGGSHSDLQDIFYYSESKLFFIRSKTLTSPYSSRLNGFDFAAPHVKGAADYHVRDGKLIPLGRAKIPPSVESRLLQEAELFITAARQGSQVVDIEKLVK
jgi:hypothetical protein